MRSLVLLVLASTVARAETVIPVELRGFGIEGVQGEHQLTSVRVLEKRTLAGTRIIVWEERSRFVDGPKRQVTRMLGIGSVDGQRILQRVLVGMRGSEGEGAYLEVEYAWAFRDVNGDRVPELILERTWARAHEYGAIAVPGQGRVAYAPRSRWLQVRAGGLHEVPRAIARCPLKGVVAAPLSVPHDQALSEDGLALVESEVGRALTKDATAVRCALWDRFLAGGERPLGWARTITDGIPAPDTGIWLEPAGERGAAAWFRTTDGSAARLTWDGHHLQVIEPTLPPVWPGDELDEKRPPNEVRRFQPVRIGARLMLYLELASGDARRAIVIDPVSLQALVNEQLGRFPAKLRLGPRPELRIGPLTFTYDAATGTWLRH